MAKALMICATLTLLFSCVLDKSKPTNEKIQDTIADSTSASSQKLESNDDAPSYPFRLTVHEGSNWNLEIDSVTENEFDQNKKEIHHEDKAKGDSLIITFSERFKNEIILTDSCCILKGLDKYLKVCRRRPTNDREWTGYDGVDYDHGFLILMEWGYESWSYISFNPVTRQYIYTSNEPRFIDNNLIYAAGNYYAEGQFQIANLKEHKYFGFEAFNWELTAFYRQESSILMEFTSRTKKKYLRVTLN
jgi:hypothetical protein